MRALEIFLGSRSTNGDDSSFLTMSLISLQQLIGSSLDQTQILHDIGFCYTRDMTTEKLLRSWSSTLLCATAETSKDVTHTGLQRLQCLTASLECLLTGTCTSSILVQFSIQFSQQLLTFDISIS